MDRGGSAIGQFKGAEWISLIAIGVIAGLWWATRSAGSTRRPPESARFRRSASALAASAGCSAVNVLCRVLVLPLLAWGAGYSGRLGEVALGSFVLLYAQLVAPVPAGIGVVDAVFLSGGAGVVDLGVLVAWRAYTTLAGSSLGAVLAVFRLGGRTLGGFCDVGRRHRQVVAD